MHRKGRQILPGELNGRKFIPFSVFLLDLYEARPLAGGLVRMVIIGKCIIAENGIVACGQNG